MLECPVGPQTWPKLGPYVPLIIFSLLLLMVSDKREETNGTNSNTKRGSILAKADPAGGG
jgi:hypothetical protein